MMGGQPPMDPSMMGGQPPMDPSMMGGQPPQQQQPPMDPDSRLISELTVGEFKQLLGSGAGKGESSGKSKKEEQADLAEEVRRLVDVLSGQAGM